MSTMSANDAKARFGQLLDAAQREPVTIEKHGRPIAVVLSKDAYDEIEALKLERLRTEVQLGLDALTKGDSIEVDTDGLRDMGEEIKANGRQTTGR